MKNLLTNRSLPFLTGIAVLTLALIQWRAMVGEENAQIGRMTGMAVSSLKNEVAYEMDSRINALLRMAKRWESRGKLDKAEWEADAELYLEHYIGYQAIEVVDSSYNARWVVPPVKTGDEERRRGLLIAAAEQRRIAISHPVSLVDGNKGFEVYIPVFRDDGLLGFIAGVFRCRELFEPIVLHNSNYSGYGVSFFDGADEIYAHNRVKDLQLKQGTKDELLSLHGVSWRISMNPSPALLDGMRSPVSTITLMGGISLSALLTVAMYFAQTAWLRQREAESLNMVLEKEISERVLSEENLGRLAEIIETTSDFVATGDIHGKLHYYNKAARKMLGIGENEDISDIRIPDTHPEWAGKKVFNEAIPAAIRDGIWSGETVFLSRDGKEIPALQVVMSHKRPDGSVKYLSTIARDITERKKLEEQLIQSQKMEAVGQLAGGIAHDFNNILSTINGYAEFMLAKMKENDPFRSPVEEIFASGERAAGLIKRLMAFSRKQAFHPSPQNLNEIIREMEKTLLMLIREDIELKTSISDEELIVTADAVQIEQLLINLSINARDAMPDGGTLSISLEKTASPLAGDDGSSGFALITVSDTGVGMDKETRERVFEPFFTTKDIGEGTGLGLSIVYEIVKQNNGLIDLSSKPGTGATFRIYLPLSGAEAGTAHSEEPDLDGHGTEKILLAEDGALVRKYTGSILRDSGYTVIEAVDGDDAVVKFSEHRDSVALLVLDVIMPKKNGREVFEEIRKIRPDIRAIFMSAYAKDIVDKKGVSGEVMNFIAKPVSPKNMLRKVREALDNE